MDATTRRKLFWLSVFVIAMAQLEATVVVYLRELYYPDGFRFPLVILRDRIAAIEIGREAATVLMLLGVAKLYDARDGWRQYAAFLYAFGLWDILYYVWLWLLLRWPASLLEWDILFLIPLPWVGPVLAPALIAVVMGVAGLAILVLRDRGLAIVVRRSEWALVVLCGLGMITQFCWDAPRIVRGALPRPFLWWLFLLQLAVATGCALSAWRRSRGAPRLRAEKSQP